MSEKEQQSQEATIECEVIEEDYVYKEEAYEKEETYEKEKEETYEKGEEETYSAVDAKNFFDLTYTKSIEGILRLISIVSKPNKNGYYSKQTGACSISACMNCASAIVIIVIII